MLAKDTGAWILATSSKRVTLVRYHCLIHISLPQYAAITDFSLSCSNFSRRSSECARRSAWSNLPPRLWHVATESKFWRASLTFQFGSWRISSWLDITTAKAACGWLAHRASSELCDGGPRRDLFGELLLVDSFYRIFIPFIKRIYNMAMK